MLEDNPASRPGDMGCSTYIRVTHRVVAKHAGFLFNRSLSRRSVAKEEDARKNPERILTADARGRGLVAANPAMREKTDDALQILHRAEMK
jgi:hypothetical protein